MFASFNRDDRGIAPADTPERWQKFFRAARYDTGWQGTGNDPTLRLVRPFLSNTGRILEVGCGPGYWTRFLADMNYHAEGLDFSREIIDALKAAAPSIPWHHGDIRAMPFPDNTFSLLLCWGVVEHFEAGPEPALRELYRVLAPGGTCFVSVPYLNQWRQRTFKGTTNRAPGRTVFNQNYFRADEFLGCLRRVGFTNSRLIPIAKHIEVVLPMLERLKPKLLKRVMNRLLVPLVPAEVGSHMLLAITQKNGSATELAPPKHEVPRSASAGL